MNKYFKIKVGIEEFSANEADVPRIAEAMRTGSIVKLDCGLFRGTAINAVYRDEVREERELRLEASKPTPEKLEEILRQEAIDKQIRKQMAECILCDHKGWREIKRTLANGHPDNFVIDCECVKIKGVDLSNK